MSGSKVRGVPSAISDSNTQMDQNNTNTIELLSRITDKETSSPEHPKNKCLASIENISHQSGKKRAYLLFPQSEF